MNNLHKNNLKKLNASNEIAKNTFTNKQDNKKGKKHGFKNKLGVKDTKKSNVPTRYLKDNKQASEIFQKVQINTNNKTKCKKKHNKQKQDTNLDHATKDAARVDDAKERNEKLQMFVKKSIDLERKKAMSRKAKTEKFKKVNEKKKQISAKAEVQQMTPDKVLKFNKHKIKIKQLEEMLANKSLTIKQKFPQLALRDRMIIQLRASRFRFINEILYSNDSSQSKHYFKNDPDAFMAYHAGYKQQLEQWAVNPLDVIISSIKKLFVYLSLKKIYANLNTTTL